MGDDEAAVVAEPVGLYDGRMVRWRGLFCFPPPRRQGCCSVEGRCRKRKEGNKETAEKSSEGSSRCDR